MVEMIKQINSFRKEIKAKYPGLYMGYSYDSKEDYYHIWHTNSDLQYKDANFIDFLGNLINKYFYANDIFNFSFGYDYCEDEKSKYIYEVKPAFKDFIFKLEELSDSREANYNFISENYYAFHLEGINIKIDASDLIFCSQIGQASLSRKVVADDNTPDKALAA